MLLYMISELSLCNIASQESIGDTSENEKVFHTPNGLALDTEFGGQLRVV